MNDLILPIWGFSFEDVNVTADNLNQLKEKYASYRLAACSTNSNIPHQTDNSNHSPTKKPHETNETPCPNIPNTSRLENKLQLMTTACRNKKKSGLLVPDLFGFSDSDSKQLLNNLEKINDKLCSVKLCIEEEWEFIRDGVLYNNGYSNLIESAEIPKEIFPLSFWYSLPDGLCIRQSEIKEAGLGVFTEVHLPKGIQFGPNESVVTIYDTDNIDEDGTSDYSDSFTDDNEFSGSNWLRFVNYAKDKSHGNLIICENKGQISYQTCTGVLPGTELLVWHEEDHQNERTTSDECDKTKVSVQNSSAIPHSDIPQVFTCGKCGHVSSSKDDLRRHQRTHRERPKEKRHKCPHCAYAAPRRWELERHLRVHTGEKPFKCHHCKRAFNQKGDLGKHLRTHATKSPNGCKFCGQTFEELEQHQCPLRPWSFKDMSITQLVTKQQQYQQQLAGDAMVHACSQCSAKYASGTELKNHVMFKHSDEFPHKCFKCEKAFRTSSYLRRHQRKVHMKKEEGKLLV